MLALLRVLSHTDTYKKGLRFRVLGLGFYTRCILVVAHKETWQFAHIEGHNVDPKMLESWSWLYIRTPKQVPLILGNPKPYLSNPQKAPKKAYIRWTPHPVIVTIRDNKDYIRVLLYSYYTTITGWGLLLRSIWTPYFYLTPITLEPSLGP